MLVGARRYSMGELLGAPGGKRTGRACTVVNGTSRMMGQYGAEQRADDDGGRA